MNTAGLLLMSWFAGVAFAADALPAAVLATLAFGALQASGGLFAQATFGAVMVHVGYWVLSLLLMVAAQGLLA